jgi:hypothetical protein
MLDIDSRPLLEPLNDLSIMSGFGPPRPFEGPGANCFAGRCTEFDVTIHFRADFDEGELPPLSEDIRCLLGDNAIELPICAGGRDVRVSDVHKRRRSNFQISVSDSLSGVLCGFRVCGDAEAPGQKADILEKTT